MLTRIVVCCSGGKRWRLRRPMRLEHGNFNVVLGRSGYVCLLVFVRRFAWISVADYPAEYWRWLHVRSVILIIIGFASALFINICLCVTFASCRTHNPSERINVRMLRLTARRRHEKGVGISFSMHEHMPVMCFRETRNGGSVQWVNLHVNVLQTVLIINDCSFVSIVIAQTPRWAYFAQCASTQPIDDKSDWRCVFAKKKTNEEARAMSRGSDSM